MRHLGIDFGEKRIGLAVSDDTAVIATPFATLERRNDASAVDRIARIAAEEDIGAIVVGEPRRADGSLGTAALRTRSFARKLGAATGLPVAMTDESLTSREAAARLGHRASVDGRLDAVSAQILLQQALDQPTAAVPLPARRRGAAEER